MALNVKELRDLLSKLPGDMGVLFCSRNRTDRFLELETIKIVKAVKDNFGLISPDWALYFTEEDEKNKKNFLYIGD